MISPEELASIIVNKPAPFKQSVWGTVAQISPLKISVFDESAPVTPTAVATSNSFAIGDRVYCDWDNNKLVVIGGGAASAGGGALIAYGTRSGRKDYSSGEAGYLEVQAELMPGRHYEIRASNITWWASPINNPARIRLRHGPAPVSLSAASERCYIIASSTSTGAQQAQTLIADVEVSAPQLYGGLVTCDSYNADEARLYDSRIGIYDVGESLTASGILR